MPIDARLIAWLLVLATLAAVLGFQYASFKRRVKECAERGHQWVSGYAEYRLQCSHCGRVA